MNESKVNRRFYTSEQLASHEAAVNEEIRAYLQSAPSLPDEVDTVNERGD